MGKTKTKIIDDSKKVEAPAKGFVQRPIVLWTRSASGGKKPKDILVSKLLEELGEVAVKEHEEEIKEVQPKAEKKAEVKKEKKEAKKTKEKPRGRKYQESLKLIDKDKTYPLSNAVELTQKTSYTKFPGTVEVHINTNVKNIRGFAALPFSAGKKFKILVFGPAEIKDEGVIMGDDSTVSEIEKGTKLDVDLIVATPEWMPKLTKIAKILGPKGLMPSPKNGTVTENLAKTISELQSGKVEYKTEKDGQVIHLAIGKVSQPSDEIQSNIKTLYSTIGKTRIKKITLSPTMGPGVKVDLSSI